MCSVEFSYFLHLFLVARPAIKIFSLLCEIWRSPAQNSIFFDSNWSQNLKPKFGLIIFSCFNVQCRIFLLLTSFLGCTSCYKDTFAQLHRKKGREFMFICRHIVETIPRLLRGCFQAVSKATRTLDWSKSPVVKPTLTVAVYTCIVVGAVSMA